MPWLILLCNSHSTHATTRRSTCWMVITFGRPLLSFNHCALLAHISVPHTPWDFPWDLFKLSAFSTNSYDASSPAIISRPLATTLVVCVTPVVKLSCLHLMAHIHVWGKMLDETYRNVRVLQSAPSSFTQTTQIAQISSLRLFSSQRVFEVSLGTFCK